MHEKMHVNAKGDYAGAADTAELHLPYFALVHDLFEL